MEWVQWLDAREPVGGRISALAVPWRWSLYYAAVLSLVVFGVYQNRQFIYFQF